MKTIYLAYLARLYKTLGSIFTLSTVGGRGEGGGRGKGMKKERRGKMRRKRKGAGTQAGYKEHWDRTRSTWNVQ